MQKQGIFFSQPLGSSGYAHFRHVVQVSAGCFNAVTFLAHLQLLFKNRLNRVALSCSLVLGKQKLIEIP